MESTSSMHYCTLPRRHKKRAPGIIHVYICIHMMCNVSSLCCVCVFLQSVMKCACAVVTCSAPILALDSM